MPVNLYNVLPEPSFYDIQDQNSLFLWLHKVWETHGSILPAGVNTGDIIKWDNALSEWVTIFQQDLYDTSSPTFVTVKLTGLGNGRIPYHVDDLIGLADGPLKTDVDAAITASHAAVTIGTANGLSILGQALSLAAATNSSPGAATAAQIQALEAAVIALSGLTSASSPTFVTVKLTGLSDGKIPYHVNDLTGLADGPTKTDVDSAVSLKHAQSHAITSTSDHTSSATPGNVLKADASGLPVSGTNSDIDVASAVSLKHAAVTVSAPINMVGQALSLVNNAGSPATITAIDTGVLASSDTVVPTSLAVVTAIGATMAGLFEIDISGGLQPTIGGAVDTYFELDGSSDLQPKSP